MKLKLCPDCGLQFIDSLEACPKCGCPADLCTAVVTPEDTTTAQQPMAPQPQQNYVPQQPAQTAPLSPQPTMPQPDVVDYKLRRIFFFVAGGVSIFGALVVLFSDWIEMLVPLCRAMVFALLSAGLALIGMGASIKN